MNKYIVAVFATSICCIQANASANAQPTPVPYFKSDLSSMSYLLGTWHCHQKLRGSDRLNTSTYAITPDGRWLSYHDIAPPFDKYRTRTIVSDDQITFNPLSNEWARVLTDNFGDYGISTSAGWKGSALVWTDKVSNGGTLGVTTLTKVSGTEMRYLRTSRNKAGKQNPDDHAVCRKHV